MRRDAVQLDGDDADVFGPQRHLDAGELFHRHRPGVVVVHRRQIVEAIGVADVLVVGEVLADLLLAAMQIAQVRDGFEHHLAVGAQDDAQHAVGGRVLRAHVDEHLFGLHVDVLIQPRRARGRRLTVRACAGSISDIGVEAVVMNAAPIKRVILGEPGAVCQNGERYVQVGLEQ